MPFNKTTYFGRRYGEIIRRMFVAFGTELEDVLLRGDPKAFDQMKSSGKLPLGQVPILEVDGRLMCQSRAIQRYVAREVGKYGSNNSEAATIDEVTETCDELLENAAPWLYREQDPEKKAAIRKEYLEVKGPHRLSYLEKKLQSNPSGYFAGSNLTLADLAVFNILDILNDNMPEVITAYPSLLALKAKVAADEKIAKYLATRPKTEM
uniref:GST_mu-like protein n=1 Tax=Strongylocentrotus droebachiensis TaxID=7671 RepID=M1F7B7_STRDR|nr:GST_mu-like protein [Strongylocentrotus droebachiensis]